MDRRAMELLAQFCITQHKTFFPHDWYRRFESDGPAVALAAKYLSMTSWYGHETELEEIAAGTHVFAEKSAGLNQESEAIDFDLPYFSAKVRLGLASAMQSRPARRHDRRRPHAFASVGQADFFDGFRILSQS